MKKPLILTVAAQLVYDNVPRMYTNLAYYEAIEAHGGILVTARPRVSQIHELLKEAAGVLLAGGVDIHAKFYGGDTSVLGKCDETRDELEIAIALECIEQNIPLLCICRGMQILNVALGGTLHQHIDGHDDPDRARDERCQRVTFPEVSVLRDWCCADKCQVNSMHHQAIDKLGKNLEICARAEDGTVEAVQCKQSHFAIGVQWHPEETWNDSALDQMLFERFIAASSLKEAARLAFDEPGGGMF